MGNMGIFGPILGQKGAFIPPNGPFRTPRDPPGTLKEGVLRSLGGYPPLRGGFDPKKGQKPPFFVSSKGVPLVDTFSMHVSVRKMPFFTLNFSRGSDFDEEDP